MATEVKNLKELIAPAAYAECEVWVSKYPAERKRSALMGCLAVAQRENGGWLTNELMDAVADYLEVPHIAAYEVASFYSMYKLKPIGKHLVDVCTNISCMLNGSEELMAHVKNKYGIGHGETTADGRLTVRSVECLGACVGAPMCQVDSRDYHEHLTPEKLDALIAGLE
ncbi:MAG: NAD(P)H-dependent oxidoreductase subunit E [Gammaproteobacteria bacterium]|nr:NAD(P)H-dependent oxidoreductase subunit E [Gammaproteobacteria bacterium]